MRRRSALIRSREARRRATFERLGIAFFAALAIHVALFALVPGQRRPPPAERVAMQTITLVRRTPPPTPRPTPPPAVPTPRITPPPRYTLAPHIVVRAPAAEGGFDTAPCTRRSGGAQASGDRHADSRTTNADRTALTGRRHQLGNFRRGRRYRSGAGRRRRRSRGGRHRNGRGGHR